MMALAGCCYLLCWAQCAIDKKIIIRNFIVFITNFIPFVSFVCLSYIFFQFNIGHPELFIFPPIFHLLVFLLNSLLTIYLFFNFEPLLSKFQSSLLVIIVSSSCFMDEISSHFSDNMSSILLL